MGGSLSVEECESKCEQTIKDHHSEEKILNEYMDKYFQKMHNTISSEDFHKSLREKLQKSTENMRNRIRSKYINYGGSRSDPPSDEENKIIDETTTPTELYHIAVGIEAFVLPSILIKTNIRPAKIAPNSAYATPAKLKDALIGRIIKTTPKNPTITATDLRKPTLSRAIITDKIVIKSGIVFRSTVAKLMSILATAKNHIAKPKKPQIIRSSRSLMLLTLSILSPYFANP